MKDKLLPGAFVDYLQPLTKDLELCLSFDDGAGSEAHDASANADHGTINGATWTGGSSGTALSFDGNDYIDVGAPASLNITQEITIITQGLNTSLATSQFRIDKGNNQYVMQVWSGNSKLEIIIWDGGAQLASRNAAGGTALQTGQVYHLAATYDGANLKTYVNGVLDRTGAYAGDIDSQPASNFRVGPNVGGEYHVGTMEFVLVFSRALSADEIMVHYLTPNILFQQFDIIRYYQSVVTFQPWLCAAILDE